MAKQKLLGEEVVQSDGSLSREKIRDLVFNDYDLKSNLEKIVHPAVKKVISKVAKGVKKAVNVVKKIQKKGAITQ